MYRLSSLPHDESFYFETDLFVAPVPCFVLDVPHRMHIALLFWLSLLVCRLELAMDPEYIGTLLSTQSLMNGIVAAYSFGMEDLGKSVALSPKMNPNKH